MHSSHFSEKDEEATFGCLTMAELKKFFRGIGNANRTRTQGVEDGPELIIVVMGSTGTGKSSLINTLTGARSVNVSDSLGSETSDIKVTPWTFSRRRFKLVDTPGFDDTELSDTAVLKKIADFLQATFGRRVFVNGIIYLHRIIDPRMTGSSVKNLQLLQDLVGNDLKNVLLVTTFWDIVPKGQGEKREAELANNYWRPLLELGSRMHRHRHKSSGEDLIRDILDHQSHIIELQLQIELTQAERTLLDTMAGRRLQEGLNHQLEQLGITLNQVQGERRAVEGRGNTGRDERARFNAHESRILEEIAAIERDLDVLGMPRYVAMEEIDNRVAEIVTEKGRDDMDAFWDLYGTFDDDDGSGVDSPRESLGINHGQPASPGLKSAGYGDSQFPWRNTEGYSQQKNPRVTPRAYDSPQVERRDIEGGHDSQQKNPRGNPRAYDSPQVERRDIEGGYDSEPQINAEYSPMGSGGQQVDSGYSLQAFEELSISTEPQFGCYDGQQANPRSDIARHGELRQGKGSDFDEYGNPQTSAGNYGNQYRRDSRGY